VEKNLPAHAGEPGLIPESERSPGVGNSNPFQYSCQENPMDRGARWERLKAGGEGDNRG